MKATIITETETLFGSLQTLIRTSTIIDLCVAWVTSSNGQGQHWKALELGKIRRAVVGTSFAHSEPKALEDLAKKRDRLRLMIDSDGTFHPKVIFGRNGNRIRAIVGSANFTTAAYTSNTELSVLLEGTTHDPELQAIEAYIEEQWQRGTELTDEWLAEYSLTHKSAKRQRILVPRAKLEIGSLTDLDMPWSTFVELIQKQEGRKLANGTSIRVTGASPSYMEELRLAQAVFRREPRFEKQTRDERNLLMGVGSSSSGFLGSMKPAGYARKIANSEPEKIGITLDRLPLEGPVSHTETIELLSELMNLKGVKIGVATRFFAVKRPDLFVSVNNGSNPQLAKLLGGREVTTIKQYISLLGAVWASEWHSSPPPADPQEVAIWDRRAALLDAALYEST